MDILQIIIYTVISTGVLTAFISYNFDKKIKTHELKLQKYFELIEEISKLLENNPNYDALRRILNDALFFSSDNVCREILKFNKMFTKKREEAKGTNFQMSEDDIKPLIKAIRKDLNLKSKSIDKEGLRFFQKP